jgi:hypothetical protein
MSGLPESGLPHGTSGTNMGTLLLAIAGDTRPFKQAKKELNFQKSKFTGEG